MRTLLLGIDGATFSILDALVEDGVMPFLGRFAAEGARANLRSTVPALTPPAWTSMMTGRSPGYHGVFDFFRRESLDSHHIRFATSNDLEVETIWSMASRNGMTSAVFNFPLMFPSPKIAGYVIPGWVPWRMLRLACHPRDLFERLKREIPGFNPRELAMDTKLEEKATEGLGSEDDYEPWIELHIRREQNWLGVIDHLQQAEDCDLAAVVFDGADKLQHLCWRFIDPAMASSLKTDRERRVRDLCLEYYRQLDRVLERICERAGEETTVFIASDHGFGATAEVFYVNAWLEQNGFLAWKDSAAVRKDCPDALLGVGQVARHTFQMDWERTSAFVTTPTSNGIYIAGTDGGGSGDRARYEKLRDRLREMLPELVSPISGKPIVRRIWTREEAFAGPAGVLAPDLTLELSDGGLVSILPSDDVVRPRPEVAGTHRPEGVFLARGPGIRAGARVAELSILDVAPSILYSLDLPVPVEFEGRVPEEIHDPAALKHRPVRTADLADEPEPRPAAVSNEPVLRPEDERIIAERMRQLGYIE